MTSLSMRLAQVTRANLDQIAPTLRPRRAWVGTETNGKVTLAWSRGGTVGQQQYPRLAGPALADGAEVLVLPIGDDQFVVLGAAQVGAAGSTPGPSSPIFVEDRFSTFDDFTGRVLTTHVGEIGAAWSAHASAAGEWSWFDGRMYPTTAGIVVASGTPASPDYIVSCRYRYLSNTGAVGIAGRIQSGAATCYYAYHNSGQWVLARLAAGTPTTIDAVSATLTAGQDYWMELEMDGNQISLRVNGVAIGSSPYTDGNITAAGFAGLRSAATVTTTTGKHLSHFRARNV